MNDFTKEELQILHLDMTHNILKEKILNVSPSYMALRDKIENMIDDYCEHELYCTGCNSEQKHIYCAHCKKSMKKIME